MSPPLGEKHLRAVSRERLRERTAAELREYVLANRLAPGTQLPPEPALAEQLGVSRNVLRQAVASLEGIGMLKVAHGSGTYVADPADSEVFRQIAAWMGGETLTEADYLEVRSIWERGVYTLVMERASDAELEHLEELGEAIAGAADPEESQELHDRFHATLLRLTGNSFLVTMGTILARFFWEFGYATASVRKPPEQRLFAAHGAMVAVMRHREPSRLQELVDLHLSPNLLENGAERIAHTHSVARHPTTGGMSLGDATHRESGHPDRTMYG
ncbi:MAG TPA: GntR family transcriptional regulator [Acidimicrobiales bacterium]|nr:GntR family transcriptional regulator [Acidimicrobiales bacterium]